MKLNNNEMLSVGGGMRCNCICKFKSGDPNVSPVDDKKPHWFKFIDLGPRSLGKMSKEQCIESCETDQWEFFGCFE